MCKISCNQCEHNFGMLAYRRKGINILQTNACNFLVWAHLKLLPTYACVNGKLLKIKLNLSNEVLPYNCQLLFIILQTQAICDLGIELLSNIWNNFIIPKPRKSHFCYISKNITYLKVKLWEEPYISHLFK